MPPRKPRPRVDEPPRGAPRGRDERGELCVIILIITQYQCIIIILLLLLFLLLY